ncbi:Cell division cycle 5-like protein [Oopsacas minuta]|uniref:Cell division cycle 5-like protein n=1 Tax=Oopsacas minuta TaxID=111878 RepID=A0AAV7JB52_9METZ|nr:Cell division cycle 5-like protein [Oopsacas minuta]
MPRILIKGGIWRNTEDEILKAAVMKYGPNQWSRVASLFHKKSTKQCKARWFEWLDPSIKKTEWTREEEEKLLNLAKLFPCQWRTIAPHVGRTAAQCLEHYEYLLDKAQRNEGETGEDDIKRLRSGELDTCPENKPALPDPEDMDEDEIEMLSEARARLANTQGKKAKRKAREKQLEEARRLTSLMKRRELREAGIELDKLRKKKRRGVDYNAEIPFEKQVPPGFYDISMETAPVPELGRGTLLQNLEGMSRDEMEERERKKDKDKQAKRKQLLSALINQPGSFPELKRSKLVLPSPQISEQELEEMIKVGQVGEQARELANESGVGPSNLLLSSYSMTGTSAGLRTPQTPAGEDFVTREAQNLLLLSQLQTPLKGGEDTPLHDTGTQGVIPKPRVVQTPNTLLSTPFRTPNQLMTPGTSVGTPGSIRDRLSINQEDSSVIESVREHEAMTSLQLQHGLAALPSPKNDFQIVMPSSETEPEECIDNPVDNYVEDQAELDDRMEAMRVQELQDLMARQSQSLQRELPRPLSVNKSILRGQIHADQRYKELYEAEELLKLEMLKMVSYDLVNFPSDVMTRQQKSCLAELGIELEEKPLEDFDPDEILDAARLIREEEHVVREAMEHGDISQEGYIDVWEDCFKQVLYLPSQNKYTRASMAYSKDKVESLERRLLDNRSIMTKEAKNAAKIEKKVKVLLKGYEIRSSNQIRQLEDLNEQISSSYRELSTFHGLRTLEEAALPHRREKLSLEVEKQRNRHRELQNKYSDILLEREQLAAELNTN